MGNLGILFSFVLDQYPKRPEKYVNSRSPVVDTLRCKIPQAISRILAGTMGSDLIIKGSAGAGGWARIPWVAVYNKRATKRISEGLYIAYLFDESMSLFYLTLIQGSAGLTKLQGSFILSEILNHFGNVKDFLLGPMPVGSITPRSTVLHQHPYEKGCVLYRRYEKNPFPDDCELKNDLLNMVNIYKSYLEIKQC